MRPDLDSPAGQAAYRAEMRTVAWGMRCWGFALVVLGIAGLLFHRAHRVPILTSDEGLASLAALAAGWALLLGAIVKRARYHRRRMAET